MAKRSKFFCIAVEGATCDGRTLDRNALSEMAETYDPKTYSARINMEHIRGFSADPPFNAYGDVVALETREIDIKLGGKTEKKLGLFAQVDALDTLVELKSKGQKLFSSIELNPNFAGTGKAYLQGLAVTDSPASLGTEIMEFCSKQIEEGRQSLFHNRKVEAGNFFSAAREVDLEFEEGHGGASNDEIKGLFSAATDFFKNFGKYEGKPVDPPKPPETPANDNVEAAGLAQLSAAMGTGFEKLSAAMQASHDKLSGELGSLRSDHDTLAASIENTDAGGAQRPRGTGTDSQFRTDC